MSPSGHFLNAVYRCRAFSFSGGGGGVRDSQQGEWLREAGSVAAQGSGHVGMTGASHQGDHQVAQRCHHLGRCSGSYLRAVFVKGDVPHPVDPVFDSPVPPRDLQQLAGSGGGETGDRIAHRHLTPAFHRSLPLQPAYLFEVAKPPPPHRNCPHSRSTLGQPRPTVPAAPAAHGAASPGHPPTPSTWPLVPHTPAPAKEAPLVPGPPPFSTGEKASAKPWRKEG